MFCDSDIPELEDTRYDYPWDVAAQLYEYEDELPATKPYPEMELETF